MKYMRRTAGCIWIDCKTNAQIAKELKITPILDKLVEYKRNWIQHVNRMPRNRLPRVMKRYSTTGRRNHGRPLKRLLDTWDWNGSTSGPTPWQIRDVDDDIVLYTFVYVSRRNNGCTNAPQCYDILALHCLVYIRIILVSLLSKFTEMYSTCAPDIPCSNLSWDTHPLLRRFMTDLSLSREISEW